MASLIERFDSISRECDGLAAQLAAERARCTSRSNVSRIAMLEQLLAARWKQMESLDDGVAALEKASPTAFWRGIESSRADACFMAARR